MNFKKQEVSGVVGLLSLQLPLTILAVILMFAPQAARADIIEEARLTASDGGLGQGGGYTIAISNDTVVIGESRDDVNGGNSGAAYVFRGNGRDWVAEAKLLPADGKGNMLFGSKVSVSGDTALIGAFFDGERGAFPCCPSLLDESGSAYVFRYDGMSWTEEAKLRASDGEMGDHFGGSVAIQGDTAVVGAPGHRNDSGNYGTVYVFGYDGNVWTEKAKLTIADGRFGFLGHSVSIFDDLIIAGAPSSGGVHVFRFDGSAWVETAKITASDGGSSNGFGRSSLSIFEDTIIVGAAADSDIASRSGSAYVFRFDGKTWVEEAKLTASDASAGDYFGGSASIYGGTAVVAAAQRQRTGHDDLGAVYVFRFDGRAWQETVKLEPFAGPMAEPFRAAAIFDDTIVVRASASGRVFRIEPDVVDIDIKPGNDRNLVNVKARGVIPVAILGSDTFDVLDVDVSSLVFGPVEITDVASIHKRNVKVKDVNGDAIPDLLTFFPIRASGLGVGDLEACVSGTRFGGRAFDGCDAIKTLRSPHRSGWSKWGRRRQGHRHGPHLGHAE